MDNGDNRMNIELKAEVAKGCYSNIAVITHSRSEFVLDFAVILPGLPKTEVQSRVVMAPEHAKRLLAALSDNISKYEAQFGEIELENPSRNGAPDTINLADLTPNGTKS